MNEQTAEIGISDESAAEQAPVVLAPMIDLQPVVERLDRLEDLIAQLNGQLKALAERTDLLPRQLRSQNAKIDDITESINQTRLRDLLNSLLMLHDLAEQMAGTSEPANLSNFEVLRSQILETLALNGISPIPVSERFDPALHRAIESVPCPTPEEEGQIVRVCSVGFRTARAVLRPSQVVVKHYTAS